MIVIGGPGLMVSKSAWPIVSEVQQVIPQSGAAQFIFNVPPGINLLFRVKIEFFALGPTAEFGIDIRYAMILRKSDGSLAIPFPQTNSLLAGGSIFDSFLPIGANQVQAECFNIPLVEDVQGYVRVIIEAPKTPPFALNWP